MLFLCMAEYSILSLPNIGYDGFYDVLGEWSKSLRFPDLLRIETSKFWDTPVPIEEGRILKSNVSQGPSSSDAAPPFLNADMQHTIHEWALKQESIEASSVFEPRQ
ncbi:hypothetical protein BDV10DRAFT_189398 [Aspergillus recurvatus]